MSRIADAQILRYRAALADIFLRAAEIMDDPFMRSGCCHAIEKAQPMLVDARLYGSPAHQAFNEVFDWMDYDHEKSGYFHWFSSEKDGEGLTFKYPEESREARVLALLFCAEMARAGEIG